MHLKSTAITMRRAEIDDAAPGGFSRRTAGGRYRSDCHAATVFMPVLGASPKKMTHTPAAPNNLRSRQETAILFVIHIRTT